MIDFDNEKFHEVIRAQLIIAQQEDIVKENIGTVADDFGVSKAIAKKIIKAYCVDTLEKTQEKLEDERSSLANAEVLIEAIEDISPDHYKDVEENDNDEDDED